MVWHQGFLYQAASWRMARRVFVRVEHHPGELFPHIGFIVTKLKLNERAFSYVKELMEEGMVVRDGRDAWSEDQPSAEKEKRLIRRTGCRTTRYPNLNWN